jgi:hypothetical protein
MTEEHFLVGYGNSDAVNTSKESAEKETSMQEQKGRCQRSKLKRRRSFHL